MPTRRSFLSKNLKLSLYGAALGSTLTNSVYASTYNTATTACSSALSLLDFLWWGESKPIAHDSAVSKFKAGSYSPDCNLGASSLMNTLEDLYPNMTQTQRDNLQANIIDKCCTQ